MKETKITCILFFNMDRKNSHVTYKLNKLNKNYAYTPFKTISSKN